jgi:type IV secretion system protein VirB6
MSTLEVEALSLQRGSTVDVQPRIGYRLITGQSREPATIFVTKLGQIGLIVMLASTVSLVNDNVRSFVTTDMSNAINHMVNGSDSAMVNTIDRNLAHMQLAYAAIDSVQVPIGDSATAEEKARSLLIATLGTAGPAMTAGAMLLYYQVAMALVMGLAPLFILCLIFDQTKELFRQWLMYTISTLFSMAVLNAMVAIALKATINTAEALWAAKIVQNITHNNAEGFNSQALQQGGVGLLMTVLIISAPYMAGQLFRGTLGQFMHFSAFGGGAMTRPGPQGQPPGSYGGGYVPPTKTPINSGSDDRSTGLGNPSTHPQRTIAGTTDAANHDVVKYKPRDGERT